MPFLSSSYLRYKIECIYIICIYFTAIYQKLWNIFFSALCFKFAVSKYWTYSIMTYLLTFCRRQCSAWIGAVWDSAQLESALSGTALSLNQRCLGQCSAWISAVWDSAQPESALSGTVLSLMSGTALSFDVAISGQRWSKENFHFLLSKFIKVCKIVGPSEF